MSEQQAKQVKLADHLASKALKAVRLPKKQEEERLIRGFLSRIGVDNYDLAPRERPDFLVSANGGVRIACEVARYFSDEGPRGSVERRFFRLWTDLALSLRKRLSEEHLDHLYGAVHFREPNRTEIPAPNAFVEEVVRALHSHRHGGVISVFDPETFPLLAIHVVQISVRDTSPERGILWWCGHLQSGSVESSPDSLWKQMKTKDEEALSYEWPDCSEKWLVIYAAANGLADIAPLFVVGCRAPRLSYFDRAFLWDQFQEKVYQVAPPILTIFDCPNIYVRRLPECVREVIGPLK